MNYRILSLATLLLVAAGVAPPLLTPRIYAQDARATVSYAGNPREDAPIPRPGMSLVKGRVAVVITDPQNDFLTTAGVAWGAVGQSVTANKTVENLESLFKAAGESGVPVFVSPHYYYRHDHQWKFEGALEALMHQLGMFDRKGALVQEGFSGSGPDWLDRYKPYINDGKTVVTSPHKVFGSQTNDLVLQLRKAGITQVILAGMSANLCVESHMRDLIEQGFQVVVVPDATAAAKFPGYDGFEAAFVNYRMIASDVWSTAETTPKLAALGSAPTMQLTSAPPVRYRNATVRGVRIHYREAGPANAPVVLLMHGFPTSSHMYRDLIPALAENYRVIAPDFPAFGASDQPLPSTFEYTFENLTRVFDELTTQLGISSYVLYVMDYGAPVGFRLALWHPERVRALVIQDANAYLDGIGKFWEPFKAYWTNNTAANQNRLRPFLEIDAQKWQYQHGVRDQSRIAPDNWLLAQAGLDRPGNKEIQLKLFYDYRNVLPLYPELQAYFRKHQPPSLVLWGKNDEIFLVAGAHAYKRDLPQAEIHVYDTGHFALEEQGGPMAAEILAFLGRTLKTESTLQSANLEQ
jgi:pimeloyl-ACP methyl ester carboxylesterase/nicotinamidase-related amidase